MRYRSFFAAHLRILHRAFTDSAQLTHAVQVADVRKHDAHIGTQPKFIDSQKQILLSTLDDGAARMDNRGSFETA